MTADRETQTPTDEADTFPRPPPVLGQRRALFAIVIPSIMTVTVLLAAALTLPSCAGESTVGSGGGSTTLAINAAGLNWVRVPIDEQGWLIPDSLAATPYGFVLFARPTAEYSWPTESSGPASRWESTNGLEWAPMGTDEDTFRSGERIGNLVGNSWGAVAMGVVYPPSDDDQGEPEYLIWTSEDGQSWKRTDWPAGCYPNEPLTVGPAGYLLGERRNDQSRLLHSPNGLAWEPVDLPDNVEVISGAGFAGGFAAWGREFDMEAWPWLLLTSTDGHQWTIRSMDEALGRHGEATFSAWREEVVTLVNLEIDDAFRGDKGLWRSSDGIAWTEMEGAPIVNADGSWPEFISSGDAGIFLTGLTQEPQQPPKTTVVWFSSDGEVWHRAETADVFGSGWSIVRTAVGNNAVLVATMADEEPTDSDQGDSFTLPPVGIWIGTPTS